VRKLYDWNKEFNPKFLNDFLDYRYIVENKSKETVYTNNSDIRDFLKFQKCYKIYKDITKMNTIQDISDLSIEFVENLDVPDIMQYMNYLVTKNSSKTRANKVITVRTFYKYLHLKLRLIKQNKFADLEIPQFRCKTVVVMPLNECKQLLDTVKEKKLEMWERDLCIITLFLNTGVRLSELANATMNNLDLTNAKITVLGKGNKERTVPLNESCIKALKFYFEVRKGECADLENRKYIFLSKKFKKMGKRTLQEMLKKYLELAELDTEKYTIHKLRHTCATLMYKNGVDIRTIQNILGHEHISTTEIYTHVEDEDMEKGVKQNPLNNICL